MLDQAGAFAKVEQVWGQPSPGVISTCSAASWLLRSVKVLKASESSSLPKQRGGRPSTLASVRSMWGSPGPAALATPGGSWSPAAGTPGLFLSSQPSLATLRQSWAEPPPTGRGSRLYKGYRGDTAMSRGQRSGPETFRRQISARLCLLGGLLINPEDKPK